MPIKEFSEVGDCKNIDSNGLKALILNAWVACLCSIAYYFIGYFAVENIKNPWDYELKAEWGRYTIYLWLVATCMISGVDIIYRYPKLRVDKQILFASLVYLASLIVNLKAPSPISMAALFFIFWCLQYKNIKNSFVAQTDWIFWVVFLYCVAPIVLYILQMQDFFQLKEYLDTEMYPPVMGADTFRGFTFDRIEYSMVVGIAILLCFAIKQKKKVFFMVPLLCGLLLAESRASFFAISVASGFLVEKNKKVIFLSAIAIFGVLVFIFGSRVDDFSDTGGRFDLVYDIISLVWNNPKQFFFGSGELYTGNSEGVPAHNSIAQTIVNFGAFAMVVWVLLLKALYQCVHGVGRAFFVYVLLFGLFHPGFDGFFILPIFAFCITLAIVLSNRCEMI